MSYKTILVQVEDARNSGPCIETAARIAAADNAHLIGVALTGVSRYLQEALPTVHNDPNRTESYAQALRRRAVNALTRFEEVARRCGVTSLDTRMIDDEYAPGFIALLRCADLVVLAQPDPADAASLAGRALPEYVLMTSGVPGLVIPHLGATGKIGTRALLGWDASVEAVRALHYALPLLERATQVEVVIFNAESHLDLYGDPPGADIAHYLLRHAIKVDVLTPATAADIGAALLTLASVRSADLLVMGCYGHARFRELVLGGATQTVLKSMTLPVLMAH